MAGGETSAMEERDWDKQEAARGILAGEGVGQGDGDEWVVLEDIEVFGPENLIFVLNLVKVM